MSVGDGGGSAATPDEEQASLVNELFRLLNSLKLSDSDSIIIAEMIIPVAFLLTLRSVTYC